MADAVKVKNVLEVCNVDGRFEELQSFESGLDACQKGLNDYLDSKRNGFPRFFFISDDELLSILGSYECTCVQEHMIKMFDNIKRLQFGSGAQATHALGMTSGEGEKNSVQGTCCL
jgi:dynein heavy chain